MFIQKFFYFLKGYVIIDIIGGKGNHLLNVARENGIFLWNVTPSRAHLKKKDLKKLKALALSNRIEFVVSDEISFLKKYFSGYGWFFILGSLLVSIFFLIASGYIWKIEVHTDNEILKAEVLDILSENGVKIGAKKSALPTGNSLRDSIIYGTDSVSWAWVYIDGILARVELSQKTKAPEIPDNTEKNIIASKDGILYSVSAKNGKALYKKGDKVEKGDIVISGVIESPDGNFRIVSAKGEVLAETSYTESIIVPLYKTYTEDTGNTYTMRTLRLFSWEIPLKRIHAIDFESYRTEEKITPFGICTYRYIETESTIHQIPIDTAVFEAKEYMYKKILSKTEKNPKKIFENVTYQHITSDKIKVTLTMNFIENIGEESQIYEWQTEEILNDKAD